MGVKVGPSLIQGAGQGLIATRALKKNEYVNIGYTGVEITRQQAEILEKAGRATHVKSDRGTDRIIDGHPSRFEGNQVQLAAQTANTICKEDQEYVCDGARVNARYVFGKDGINWGSLIITKDVSAGSELLRGGGTWSAVATTVTVKSRSFHTNLRR